MIHDVVDVERWKAIFPIEDLRAEMRAEMQEDRDEYPDQASFDEALADADPYVHSTMRPRSVAVLAQIDDKRALRVLAEDRVPTDVFVLSRGEPPRREVTKIGGAPCWPASKAWPTNASGEPLTFVAQLSFLDSQDIVIALPGEILLIFADGKHLWSRESTWVDDAAALVFIWADRTDEPLLAPADVPPSWWRAALADTPTLGESLTPCFGSIYRTYDCRTDDDDLEEYLETRGIKTLNGIKVGGIPNFIQGANWLTDLFLGQVGSDWPYPGDPFPYINVEQPFRNYQERNLLWGDSGILYLYMDPDRRIRWVIDSH